MKTYLDEDLDSSEAIEFLCLAEGGEVNTLSSAKCNDKRCKKIGN